MPSARDCSWGSHALLLALPTGAIRFTGLSAPQARSLGSTYARFLTADNTAAEAAVVCAARRWTTGPAIDPERLAVAGLYTPLKLRGEHAIEVTGVNFQARLPLQGDSGQASLDVAREDDLVLANVIENFLRILSAHQALVQGGLVLHSAGLVFEGQAWIFAGRSGVGKTTLTRKAHSSGAIVLSDDVNLLLPVRDGYRAYAVPFTGEFGRSLNHTEGEDSYPVAGVVLLEQGEQLAAHRVTRATATARLLVGCPFVNTDEAETDRLLDNLEGLATRLPVIRLQNRREDTVENIMKTLKRELSHD